MTLEESLARHRPELLAHCYRITGSLSDAEDAVQEAYVRAWNAAAAFEGRASPRSWLYTIASRTALDVVARRGASRTLPLYSLEPGDPNAMPEPKSEPVWLEPLPDALIADAAAGPEARMSARQSVELAALATLQLLPPRQRAAFVLSEVAGYSAHETAEMLELTVPAVNSALQRARAALEERRRPTDAAADPSLLKRFVAAIEGRDAAALVSLMRDDAALSMPPFPYWLRGRDAIGRFFAHVVFGRPDMSTQRLLPASANGCPAFGAYAKNPAGVFVPAALDVLVLRDGLIGDLHSFIGGVDFARFGLPLTA